MKKLTRKFLEVPYTFLAMNAASVAGLYAFIKKRKDVWVRSNDREVWESIPAPAVRMPAKQSQDGTLRVSKQMRKAA